MLCIKPSNDDTKTPPCESRIPFAGQHWQLHMTMLFQLQNNNCPFLLCKKSVRAANSSTWRTECLTLINTLGLASCYPCTSTPAALSHADIHTNVIQTIHHHLLSTSFNQSLVGNVKTVKQEERKCILDSRLNANYAFSSNDPQNTHIENGSWTSKQV